MIHVKQLMLATGMGAALLLTASPSMARSHYYEPGDNGSVWSNYSGYTDQVRSPRLQRRSAARVQAHAAVNGNRFTHDDPPGSAFQDWGNREDMGD